MIRLTLDVSENILAQFAAQLEGLATPNTFEIHKTIGEGRMKLLQFPNQIEVYHFHFRLAQPVEMQSFNPENSDWLLLNINLSQKAVKKTVNDAVIDIQKFLPSGILLYTPKTKVQSVSPPMEAFEIVLIRMHRSFFDAYLTEKVRALQNAENAVIYEDLAFKMENNLLQVVNPESNALRAHGALMQFMADFIDRLKSREEEHHFEHLHPDDIKGLFMASAHLRNPLVEKVPSIPKLAEIAGMGTTKFKTTFKQVFGKPPIQYHQKIKFEYARQELLARRKTASELSYELGYSHPSKFTEAFKKQFGTLPSSQA